MRALSSLCLLAVAVNADNAASRSKVTPIEKVMELMKKLSSQVAAEGKKEAAQYDKFACFCKEQADEKLYNIEKSRAIIKKQSSKIAKLKGQIGALDSEINLRTQLIEQKEAKIKAAEDLRATQHAAYKVSDGKMQSAIGAIEGAIKALKDSKKDIKSSNADADMDLMEIKAYTYSLTAARAAAARKFLAKLQGPHSFEYQSNDIIAVLEDLKDQFLENKKQLDQDEFETNSAFERKKLGLVNEVKFAQKDKDEMTAVREAKAEDQAATEEERDTETQEMNADQAFLDELTSQCQTKANEFDQRSTARSGELTALSQALEALESGAADQYAANKKLNLVQKTATSFLQRSSSTEELKVAAAMKVQGLLAKKARSLQSPVLSVMSMKVKVMADHFVKVRGLIKDLIKRLEDDAESEATQKGFCDKNMAEATNNRDAANAKIEVAVSEIAKLTSEMEQLKAEISDLEQAISDNLKALNEQTELREAEKAENEATVETAKEGKAAVELAISILGQFYNNAFVQTAYVPPKSDRSGNTVGDLAPETFSGDYHGSQTESKGIIGLLEVILSDFERTISTTNTEESTAAAGFAKFESDTKADNKAKNASIKKKDARISTIKDTLVDRQSDKEDGLTAKDNAINELKKLKPLCVEGEETYVQRVAKREKEIQALKDAMVILDEWQK